LKKYKSNSATKFTTLKTLCVVFIFQFCSETTFAQKATLITPSINFGIRNMGIMAIYRIFQNSEGLIGVNINRYNNIGTYIGFRIYPLEKAVKKSFYGGSPFVSIFYNYSFSSKVNIEDSRKFVNSFNVPSNNYLGGEMGYRYNAKPAKMFKKANTGLGISVSTIYMKGLYKNYSSSIINGIDIDSRVSKINKFMKEGFGVAVTFYLLIEKLK
jgi:hypothetical protein